MFAIKFKITDVSNELKNLYNAQITKSYLIKFENGTTLNIAIEHE